MKKIALIFGVTGQDGAYLSKLLLKKKYIVHGVKRRNSTLNSFRIDDIYLDPLVKKYLNSQDTQRVIRAYEIKSFTKKSMYEWFKNTKSKYEQKDFYKIYIDFPRDELIKKINLRVGEMLDRGAITEVKKFIQLKVPRNKTASKAIGISEIKEFLDKKIKISELIEKISIKTRQYAKRQTTWGRGHMSDWNKIKSNSLNQFLKKI